MRGRIPRRTAELKGPVTAPVRIDWDTWGVPHVRGECARDVFVGLGYAMAQERLWQLDYMRRLARGELAAVMGPSAVSSDRAMRTLGLARTAERDWGQVPAEVGEALEALALGVNLWTERVKSLPIEFELLGYGPRPWRPADSIAIWKYRWWYNTGRLEQIALAELARTQLPPELEAAFLAAEWGHETIVPVGSPRRRRGVGPDGSPPGTRPPVAWAGEPAGADGGEGSNNWVAGPTRTTSQRPVLCSDPHNPFGAPSQWFEAQLTCPELDAIGAIYQGLPTVYIGRNRRAAWGVTNHVAPARDLYREETKPDDPRLHRQGDGWRPFGTREETIEVKGGAPLRFTLRSTARGPVLDPGNGLLDDGLLRLLGSPTLSLRWVGHDPDTGLGAALALQRARSEAEVLAALAGWPCPPLNFVYACADGRFGYHVAGRVPRRRAGGRGIRPANDPAHAWDGDVPFDELPRLLNPRHGARAGWVATANNPPWSQADRHYVSLAAWSDGYRMRRIRERLTEKERLTTEEVAAIQADVESARARDLVPRLVALLAGLPDRRARAARRRLEEWDFRFTTDSVAASVWAAFWEAWCRDLARAPRRFPEALVPLAAPQMGNLARRTLLGEATGWVSQEEVAGWVEAAFRAGLARLAEQAGPRLSAWRWGRLHTVEWRHPLTDRPGAPRLSTGPYPTSGGATVRAAGYVPGSFRVTGGSTYRFVADFAAATALSTTNLGQSGHPTSRHYRDQARLWLADRYKPLWMEQSDVAANCEGTTILSP
ncbi:MAG TPA: penicillin acylase family protein [Chloroflexota bacterium]|nr:penicillin acylase family protein [Chloroflexota bacterium]